MSEEPRRFFFVHLQKTGGTALFQRLRGYFGADAVYPTPSEQGEVQAVTDVDHLVAQLQQHGDRVRVVTGHFPLCVTELLGAPFTTFTVLRDPVERTLSLLRRRKSLEDRFRHQPLEDIYGAPELHDIIRNHMVKMLSLTVEELTSAPLIDAVEFDDARLERARRNLTDGINVFGLQEHFEEFCAELERQFGWDLGPPRFANRTQPSAVSDELRERTAWDNRADVELYAYATRLWEQRHAAPSSHA